MSRGSQLIAITAPFLALATITLFLRLYTRLAILRNAGAEDLLVVFAWIFAIILSGLLCFMIHTGLNSHIVELLATPDGLSNFLKRFFVGIFMYNFSLTCSKLSIALQYRRIFTGGKTHIAVWCTIVLISINFTWSFFTNLFFCFPVEKFWEPTIPGHCLSKRKVWFSYAGANIATSVILILLPVPAILALQMQVKTKIALIIILGLGVFDIILSCLRLASIEILSRSSDVTWYIQPVGIWSSLEGTVAIICASAPALRPLITKVLPNLFSTFPSNSIQSLPVPDIRSGIDRSSNVRSVYDGYTEFKGGNIGSEECELTYLGRQGEMMG